MSTNNRSGFTLTEILITVAIIAMLAGLAVPSYFRTVETSRMNEAVTTLNIIHMGEKIYRINNGSFWGTALQGGTNATNAAIFNALNVDISPVFYTDIDFSGVSAAGYTVRATRNTFQGGNTAWFYQLVWDDAAKSLVISQNP